MIFFSLDYLKSTSYNDFCKDLYYSYNITNEYLQKKYKIEYFNFSNLINKNIEEGKKNKNIDNSVRKNILDFNKLDDFIEYISNIDLDKYKDKIIKNKCNVLPDNA